MGDLAKTRRREQLKRWAGSSTDKSSDVPRRRWRGDAVDGIREPEAVPPESGVRDESSPILSRRKRVRFDRAAEFLATCASGDTEEAKMMLEEAKQMVNEDGVADLINCSNADGITALHQACIDGSLEIVMFLLDHGAKVNQVDSEGWTALHAASSCGHPDIAEYLLQKGASLSAVNCDGEVPLDLAIDETTESLLQGYSQKMGVDLEAAKRLEEEQIMKDARVWLVDGPPDNVHHPRTGATPLHVAAAKGYIEALKILCQCGLDVSATDHDGWTPLHAAAHWGQEEACRILAEQLCNMQARSNAGLTPFEVADESVEGLLEELSQKQDNWRNEQSKLDRQNQQGTLAQNKKRRSSVCRMSSKDKLSVQDQSKERGVSGSLSEEKESSPESSTVSSPDSESVATASPAEKVQTPEEKDEEEKEQDKASRTARVQPTPQARDVAAESPNGDKKQLQPKQFQAPVRDEESESQRKARSRLMRQSRRSTQGVTLTDLKEAEKNVGKAVDSPPRNVQSVSPIVTITPAERDTDPLKQVETDSNKHLAERDRRRIRRERRSTGVVKLEESDSSQLENENSTSGGSQLEDLSADYKKLYINTLQENYTLKEKLQEMELLLSQNKVELERLRQSQESAADRPALLELERFEKLALQRKAVEMEDELKVMGDLKADNQRLKDENAALIRVISKLSR
uniref:Protein phosphatase 1, regulatory subunit 12C n=1 Tax=Oryzias latipes TaxID=8090 RepID=A0A3P9MDE6_ORYLA